MVDNRKSSKTKIDYGTFVPFCRECGSPYCSMEKRYKIYDSFKYLYRCEDCKVVFDPDDIFRKRRKKKVVLTDKIIKSMKFKDFLSTKSS